MSTKLRVGNISSEVAADDLRSTFASFGPVDQVEIARGSVTGLSKGFAIVAMSRDEDAVTAVERINFTQYAGHRCQSITVTESPTEAQPLDRRKL